MHRYLTAIAITFVIGSAAKGEDWFTDSWLIDWLVIKIHYRNWTADALDILIPWRLYSIYVHVALIVTLLLYTFSYLI